MNKALTIVLCFFLSMTCHANPQEKIYSPEGLWKTIDDTTGKQKGIVKLSILKDKTLTGTILNFIPSEGHTLQEVCEACKDARHNKPIIGLVFLDKLHQDKKYPNKWVGGNILDPKTGRVYRSELMIVDEGNKLKVRGYIGLPLFGRTQEWFRADSTNFA